MVTMETSTFDRRQHHAMFKRSIENRLTRAFYCLGLKCILNQYHQGPLLVLREHKQSPQLFFKSHSPMGKYARKLTKLKDRHCSQINWFEESRKGFHSMSHEVSSTLLFPGTFNKYSTLREPIKPKKNATTGYPLECL